MLIDGTPERIYCPYLLSLFPLPYLWFTLQCLRLDSLGYLVLTKSRRAGLGSNFLRGASGGGGGIPSWHPPGSAHDAVHRLGGAHTTDDTHSKHTRKKTHRSRIGNKLWTKWSRVRQNH
jgi:hypothetical protein